MGLKPKILLITLLALTFVGISQVKYSNEFLNLGVGVRSAAMGNAVIASTKDVTAGYWNSASLSRLENNLEIGYQHSELFAGVANFDFGGFVFKIDEASFGGFSFSRRVLCSGACDAAVPTGPPYNVVTQSGHGDTYAPQWTGDECNGEYITKDIDFEIDLQQGDVVNFAYGLYNTATWYTSWNRIKEQNFGIWPSPGNTAMQNCCVAKNNLKYELVAGSTVGPTAC